MARCIIGVFTVCLFMRILVHGAPAFKGLFRYWFLSLDLGIFEDSFDQKYLESNSPALTSLLKASSVA
jgi:hypothetical protein